MTDTFGGVEYDDQQDWTEAMEAFAATLEQAQTAEAGPPSDLDRLIETHYEYWNRR